MTITEKSQSIRSKAEKLLELSANLTASVTDDYAYWTQPVHKSSQGRAFEKSRDRARATLLNASEAEGKAVLLLKKAEQLDRATERKAGDAQRERDARISACDSIKVGDLLDTTIYGVREVVKINRLTVIVSSDFGPIKVWKEFIRPILQ